MALMTLAAMGVGAASSPVRAESAERSYDIPAQDLEMALLAFSRQSGIDIVYDRPVLEGLRSTPLAGEFSAPVAIATLLRDSHLSHRFTSATAVLILRAGQGSTDGGTMRGRESERHTAPQLLLDRLRVTAAPVIIGARRTDYRPFGQIVQSAITRQLQNAPRTQGRRFQTRLAVRIDTHGIIRHLSVEQTTGDAALDGEIVRLLQDAPMPAIPPEGMPQPIWFEIVAR